MKVLCDIFKSGAKADTYLFVKQGEGLTRVPETLLEQFGKPVHAMTLVLQPQKKLAHADIEVVLDSLETRGFYLQLPPPADNYMQAINEHNTKLTGPG